MFVERWQDIYVVDFDDDEDCEEEEKKINFLFNYYWAKKK